MQYSYLQKQQIVADLTAITAAGLAGVGLKSVVPVDGVKDLTTMTWPNGLPGIVIPTPTYGPGVKKDSQHNDRVTAFKMYLVFSKSELATDYDVEKVTDQVLNALDADQTLNGTSWPTCDPATAETETIQDAAAKEWIIVTITLKAHTLIDVGIPADTGADSAQAG